MGPSSVCGSRQCAELVRWSRVASFSADSTRTVMVPRLFFTFLIFGGIHGDRSPDSATLHPLPLPYIPGPSPGCNGTVSKGRGGGGGVLPLLPMAACLSPPVTGVLHVRSLPALTDAEPVPHWGGGTNDLMSSFIFRVVFFAAHPHVFGVG